MGRKRKDSIWEHFEQTNGVSKCKYCNEEYKGKPSVTRLRKHLSGVGGGGIKTCKKVSDDVKKALLVDDPNKRPRIELGSSSNEVANLISISALQCNNKCQSLVQDERRMQAVFPGMEQETAQGFQATQGAGEPGNAEEFDANDGIFYAGTQVHDRINDADVENFYNTGLGFEHGSSNNGEVTILYSNLTPQQDALFENLPQDSDIFQGLDITNSMGALSFSEEYGACDPNNRPHIEHSPINDCEVTNVPSTSASQHNNEFQNPQLLNELESHVQIGESTQATFVQGTEPNSLEGNRNMESKGRCHVVENPGAVDQTRPYEPLSGGYELLTESLDGQSSANRNLEKIWGCLMNEYIFSIGVCGMGGVGKTTIIKHVHNRILGNYSVFWVTVSQESSIYKLQNDIAEVVGQLDQLLKEKDEIKRSAMLFHRLKRVKKFVLILDDMWDTFSAEKVGIPLRVNGGKLLLTTRSLKVCQQMECDEIIRVEPLSTEESWNLFLKKTGPRNVLSPGVEDIAKFVAKECAGLPLVISVVASSMRGEEEVSVWENSLHDLENPTEVLNHDMKEEVFKPLKFSYDRLRDEKLQQCFLYCSLFPEDYKIERGDLINYWIGEGLIDEMDTRKTEFNGGEAIIKRFFDACLLEMIDQDSVKMHDVIRDMAHIIACENPMFMVKAGVQLRDFPSEQEWPSNLDRASLMCNDISLQGHSSNLSPNCPRLKTLFLQENDMLRELSNCFFDNMQSLVVLNLSSSGIKRLPDSVSNLRNLRVLLLRMCKELIHVPSFAELENLQELDLSESGVKELPDGIEGLVNLRCLDLSWTNIQGLISVTVFQKLSCLQKLLLYECTVEVQPEALVCLTKLEILNVRFSEICKYNCFAKTLISERLNFFSIIVAEDFETFKDSLSNRKVIIWNQKDPFFLPVNLESLEIKHCYYERSLTDYLEDVNGLRKSRSIEDIFANLCILHIDGCDQLKHILSRCLAQHFQNLEYLQVEHCNELEEIIAIEEEQAYNQRSNNSSHDNLPIIVLPKLKRLILKRLPKLKSIYRGIIVCHPLIRIWVSDCPMLRKLPFSWEQENVPGGLMQCKKEWWESLEWDDPDAKQFYNPI